MQPFVSPFPLFPTAETKIPETVLEADRQEQFRLCRIQTYNWGTFSGVNDFPISAKGYLFVGPSGSGKSTTLDAHSALLTPPTWMNFNVAAKETEKGAGKDRNLMTYIRGAWGQQSSESGQPISQFLRNGTTWSAISESYENDKGQTVTLAQVMWIRGASTSDKEVKRLYLVLERPFEIRELEFIAAIDFDVRKFKNELPDAFIRDNFSAYQERFRRLLGINSERALRLLHKTQSAKNLGDLNIFLRDFMLDPPQTFDVANKLVAEFAELNAAHEAVLAAKHQRDVLLPVQAASLEVQTLTLRLSELQEELAGLDTFREQRLSALLSQALAQAQDREDQLSAQRFAADEAHSAAVRALEALVDQRNGEGGRYIQVLEGKLTDANAKLPSLEAKLKQVTDANEVLQGPAPSSSAAFSELRDLARGILESFVDDDDAFNQQRDRLVAERARLEARFTALRDEIQAMENSRSSIPYPMQRIRAELARELGVPEDKLPFAGELIQVKPEEAAWTGAIERVLRGLALSLLVDESMASAVAKVLDSRHFGHRIVYLKTTPQTSGSRSLGPDSLVRKLDIADGKQKGWLIEELKTRFDYDCVESSAGLSKVPKGVTLAGQVKHSHTRFEKDDRRNVSDRGDWLLGFDNSAKLELFKKEAFEIAGNLGSTNTDIEKLEKQRRSLGSKRLHAQVVVNLTWREIDVSSLLLEIEATKSELVKERDAHPELATLDSQIVKKRAEVDGLSKKAAAAAAQVTACQQEQDKYTRQIGELRGELLSTKLTPLQEQRLSDRLTATGKPLALDTLERVFSTLQQAIGNDDKALTVKIGEQKSVVEKWLSEFTRRWPVESAGMDPSYASLEFFIARLSRILVDDLPRFEKRFLELLQDQSNQNLVLLQDKLTQERKDIGDKLDSVNESLRTAPFNPGTYLAIQSKEKPLEDVRLFRQTLRDALSNALGESPEEAERRFAVLKALVQRLSSQETPDKNWKALVLDVRQHVEFIAREYDEDGIEKEVYSSGAGKSGGQREKLAATCLAAALRYQLAGRAVGASSYCTVVLDEAFEKADPDFTTMAMNIFKTFGFQMVIATPLAKVMTLEPFIGGACFVHIKDRKYSSAVKIDYDEDSSRLDFDKKALAVER